MIYLWGQWRVWNGLYKSLGWEVCSSESGAGGVDEVNGVVVVGAGEMCWLISMGT